MCSFATRGVILPWSPRDCNITWAVQRASVCPGRRAAGPWWSRPVEVADGDVSEAGVGLPRWSLEGLDTGARLW